MRNERLGGAAALSECHGCARISIHLARVDFISFIFIPFIQSLLLKSHVFSRSATIE